MVLSPNLVWPRHFQPRPGHEQPPAEAPLRIPATVLDIFYLRSAVTGATELAVVVGCLKGDIELVAGDRIGTLSEDLQGQIRAAEVSHRGVFRAITTRELYIATLDAVDQEARVAGFNDALHLYGRMQTRVATDASVVQATPLYNEGRLTIGRLDLLRAYLDNVAHAFQSSVEPDAQVYHLMLPSAPVADITQGSGVALVYPILDPLTFTSVDNRFLVMRIVYDLLVRLQQDLLEEQHRHPFATVAIPVPSRHRLESELQADGYTIDGDVAEQRVQPHRDQQATSLLQRLRSLAQQWSAPRISLPPQATPGDYQRLIGDVLPAISTPEDIAVAQALAGLVEARVTPSRRPTVPPATRPSQASRQSIPSIAEARTSEAPPTPKRDWSQDFTALPVTPRQTTEPVAWWQEAGMTAYTGDTQRLTPADAAAHTGPLQQLSSKDDWTQDFLAEKGAQLKRAPGSTQAAPPQTDNWSNDFATPTPKRPDTPGEAWASDFDPKT